MYQGERLEILQALVTANGNRKQAALMLQISRFTLYRKLDLYTLVDEQEVDRVMGEGWLRGY